MGVAPIWAVKKLLERANMSINDIDTVELNEAFAAQVIRSRKRSASRWTSSTPTVARSPLAIPSA